MVNSVLLFGESLKNAQFLRIITLSSNNITSRINETDRECVNFAEWRIYELTKKRE